MQKFKFFSGFLVLAGIAVFATAQSRGPVEIRRGGGDSYVATNGATLNGNNVFTGTNTFSTAGLFPNNGIGVRTLLVTNLNIVVDCATNASPPLTNDGFQFCTPVATLTMPPLLSSNSMVGVSFIVSFTNAVVSPRLALIYGGANTNILGYLLTGSTASSFSYVYFPGQILQFGNYGSFTQQMVNMWGQGSITTGVANAVDTSVPWQMYIGMTTTTSATNCVIHRIQVVEHVL